MGHIGNLENHTDYMNILTLRMQICSAVEADIDTIIALESHPENRDFLWIGTREEHLQEIADPNHWLLIFKRRGSPTEPVVARAAETACDAKKLSQAGQAGAERPECISADCAAQARVTEAFGDVAGAFGDVIEAWGDVIGYALVRLDFKSEIFELRRIAIADKGRGYGREAMEALLRLAFEEMNINRFWLDVYPDNAGGIKLYEGLGMHRDGVLRQNYKAKRGYLDQIIYSMLKMEYEETKMSSSYSEMEAKHEG